MPGPAPEIEPEPGGLGRDAVQVAVLDAAGGGAVGLGADAVRRVDTGAAISVSIAAVAHGQAVGSAYEPQATGRVALMGIAARVIGAVGGVVARLAQAGARIITRIGSAIQGVARAVGAALRWARTAIGGAVSLARSFASRLRSLLGGVGETIMRFLASLLAPARNALHALRQAAARVLANGLARLRAAVSRGIAFVVGTVGPALEGALAAILGGVRSLAAALRDRLATVRGEVARRASSARAALRRRMALATAILRAARSLALGRMTGAIVMINAAVANGYPRLETIKGKRQFMTRARVWRKTLISQRKQVRKRYAATMGIVKRLRTVAEGAIASVLQEARGNARATRASITGLEANATTGAEGIRAAVQQAGASAIGSINEALAEGDRLVREVAGEGDRDAADLQGLVDRASR